MRRILILLPGLLLGQNPLLENFVTNRDAPIPGEKLWEAYNNDACGNDTGQVFSLDGGAGKLIGSTDTSCAGVCGCGVYLQFHPAQNKGYVWPDNYAQSWLLSGTFSAEVNRLRFKMKCGKSISRRADGGDILQVGTYIKSHDNLDAYPQGAHYYHNLDPNLYADRWLWIELTRKPTHYQGGGFPPNDPEFVDGYRHEPSAVHYFDGLTRFYIDSQNSQLPLLPWASQTCYFDSFVFRTVSGESEDKVASLTGTHNGSAYEVTFQAVNGVAQTYNIRYSTTSMKSTGFASGTDGGQVSNRGDDYTSVLWTSPAMAEQPGGLYVAIQPVGDAAFTELLVGDYGSLPSPSPTALIVGSAVITGEFKVK